DRGDGAGAPAGVQGATRRALHPRGRRRWRRHVAGRRAAPGSGDPRTRGRHRRHARGHARLPREASRRVEGALAVATFEGTRSGAGLTFAIVVARFNDFVTARLLSGAQAALAEAGVSPDAVDIVWVPGA